jgi:hypothetical protein
VSLYSVAALIAVRTAAAIYTTGLSVATGLGVDTTTWRTGDPTRSTYKFLAEVLAEHDGYVADYIRAGFLSTAFGDWLKILAVEVYGVTPAEATYATAQVTVKNNGGGTYPIGARDLTFKSSLSNKTYHNVSATATLAPGVQITIDVEADEAGSDSSAGVDEIDQLVTTKLGVDILGSTAAVGIDAQSDDSIKADCTASLGALSPDGPPDAYRYVATRSQLTGVQDVTRAVATPDAVDLTVSVYLASPSGPVALASVTAVQTALRRWATPLCVEATAINSLVDLTPITLSVSGSALPIDLTARINTALGALFAELPIGSTGGYDIDPTTITTCVRNAVPEITAIPAYTPNTPTHVAEGHVPVLGAVSVTVV